MNDNTKSQKKIDLKNRKTRLITLVLIFLLVTFQFFACGKTPANNSEEEYSSLEIYNNSVNAVAEVISDFSVGTAFLIKNDGERQYYATNKHIFENNEKLFSPAAKIRIGDGWNENKTFDGKVIGYDSYHDIAVVLIQNIALKDIKPLVFSDKGYTGGEKLVAIGNAIGQGLAVYDGIVSKYEQIITFENSVANSKKHIPVTQVTVPINKGCSGCPVFDGKGLVAGVGTYQLYDVDNPSVAADRISYIVPSKIASKISEQIINCNPNGENELDELALKKIELEILELSDGKRDFVLECGLLNFRAKIQNSHLLVTYDYDQKDLTKVLTDDKIIKFGNLELENADLFDIFSEFLNYYDSFPNEKEKLKFSIIDKNGNKKSVIYDNVYEKSF